MPGDPATHGKPYLDVSSQERKVHVRAELLNGSLGPTEAYRLNSTGVQVLPDVFGLTEWL